MKFEIEDYIRSNLTRVKTTSSGELTASCPFCGVYGGFYINPKSGNYICFKCERSGWKALGVIAHLEDLTPIQAEAFLFKNIIEFRRKETVESLKDRLNAVLGKTEEDEDELVEVELPLEFVPVFKDGKWKFPKYLKSRGIKKETAKKWGMGFCNFGYYSKRIVVPFSCPNGRSFVTRAVDNEIKPKMLDPKNSKKSSLIFGWEFADINKDLTIVEGPFDCIMANQNGLNVVSLLGKILHGPQLELLKNRPKDAAITIMLDPEEKKAPLDIANAFLPYSSEIYIAKLPDGEDPGSATKEQLFSAYHKAEKYDGWTSRLSFLKNQLKKKK